MFSLESLIGHNNIRYFSYGRHALAQALKIIGVGMGDTVLLPEFICRDLLSAINTLGAVPLYYPVNRKLSPASDFDNLPAAKAIIAVNYFGFPQNLTPFMDYCKRTGALVIEDNAHGLFSRDEDGQLLGTRGDIGIFSLRKTIFMPDGAALVLNNLKLVSQIPPQLEFAGRPEPFSFGIKKMLKRFPPSIGMLPLRLLTSIMRHYRKLRFGSEIIASLHDAEFMLPGIPNPSKNLFSYLASADIETETKRRRTLYAKVRELIGYKNCTPVFPELPHNTVPYGYPFYAHISEIHKIGSLLKKHGFECLKWPELPDKIKSCARDYYTELCFVNFL